MKVELNIGLGNNPFDGSAAALLTFNVLTKHGASNTAFRLSKGKYVGSGEDNVIAIFDWDINHDGLWQFNKVGFQTLLEALATIMTQECIAFYVQDWSDGGLTFAPEHDGERYDFDLQYFERWEAQG